MDTKIRRPTLTSCLHIEEAVLAHLNTPLNTVSIIPKVACPILLVHSRGDRDLECDNSARLFQAVMGHELSPEQLKENFSSTETGSKNYLRTFLRKEERLKRGDQWPVVSYLETEKGVRESSPLFQPLELTSLVETRGDSVPRRDDSEHLRDHPGWVA